MWFLMFSLVQNYDIYSAQCSVSSLKCSKCDKSFTLKKYLNEHLKNFHPSKSSLLECSQCGKKLCSIPARQRHEEKQGCSEIKNRLWNPDHQIEPFTGINEEEEEITIQRRHARKSFIFKDGTYGWNLATITRNSCRNSENRQN